jgi:hypothetical protein
VTAPTTIGDRKMNAPDMALNALPGTPKNKKRSAMPATTPAAKGIQRE